MLSIALFSALFSSECCCPLPFEAKTALFGAGKSSAWAAETPDSTFTREGEATVFAFFSGLTTDPRNGVRPEELI